MKKEIIILLSALLLSSCNASGTYHYSNKDKFTGASELILNEEIEKLHLYWINGSVNISESNDNTFSYKETSNKDIELSAFYYLNNEELIIHFVEDGTKNSKYGNLNKTIDITIPSSLEKIEIDNVNTSINLDDLTLKQIDLDNVNGNIDIENLNCENIDFDLVNSNIDIDYINCNDINIEVVNGNIEIDKIKSKDVDIERVNGDLLIEEFDESIDIIDLDLENVNGDDTLYIKENMGYKVDVSKEKNFNSEYDNLKEYGNKKVRVNYSNVNGKLNIKKG